MIYDNRFVIGCDNLVMIILEAIFSFWNWAGKYVWLVSFRAGVNYLIVYLLHIYNRFPDYCKKTPIYLPSHNLLNLVTRLQGADNHSVCCNSISILSAVRTQYVEYSFKRNHSMNIRIWWGVLHIVITCFCFSSSPWWICPHFAAISNVQIIYPAVISQNKIYFRLKISGS